MPGSGRHRHVAERKELLLDWFRTCENLRDALLMPVGAIPRQWPEKLRLARQAEALLAQVVAEWALVPREPEPPVAATPKR